MIMHRDGEIFLSVVLPDNVLVQIFLDLFWPGHLIGTQDAFVRSPAILSNDIMA
jgi:hypothetical protein